ncbi:hypothetical protein MUK42_36021 [Musa troglodytarum]|uniref:Uncharacterized protein n=1 Tax=Musa troglodytarum TaxID=320322 RepID=A0A9E7FJW8_9LILI|nr:hypothetical protein MUK42_36021 [Musa troglodytarum]
MPPRHRAPALHLRRHLVCRHVGQGPHRCHRDRGRVHGQASIGRRRHHPGPLGHRREPEGQPRGVQEKLRERGRKPGEGGRETAVWGGLAR